MKNVKTITGILIGNFILALGVTIFVVPFGLISGGATGVSLIMQHYFNIPLTVTISFFKYSNVYYWIYFFRSKVCFNDFIKSLYLSYFF